MTSQLKVDRISPATGSEVTIDGFSAGLPEAPLDGKQYARQDGEWQQVVTGRLITTTRYTSGNFVVPSDAVRGEIYISGGGGGGANGSSSANRATGGQGYQYHVFLDDVVGGDTMNAQVGAAGGFPSGTGGTTTLTYSTTNVVITCGGGGGGTPNTGSGATGGGAAGTGSISDPNNHITIVGQHTAAGIGSEGSGLNNAGLLDPPYGAGGAYNSAGNAGSVYITWYA